MSVLTPLTLIPTPLARILPLQLRVNNLIQLHERFDELLPDLSLNLPGRVIDPELVHFLLPQPVAVDLIEHFEGDLELLDEDLA